MSLDMPAKGSDAYKSTSPFELRHASTHRLLFVVVPERRLLAINGAGPRGAADFRLATTLLRTVGAIVRGKLLRVGRGEPVRALLEVTWRVEPGLTPDEVIEALSGPTPRWRQMIELPQAATESMVVEAIDRGAAHGWSRPRAGSVDPFHRRPSCADPAPRERRRTGVHSEAL